VNFAFASAAGNEPTTNTVQFIGAIAQVSVVSGQKILVTSHKALGSHVGASNLNLYIGYRLLGSGAPPTPVGSGIFGLQVPAGTRVPMGMSAVINGLDTGIYEVGLMATTGHANWNSNEYGSTTALVFQ
jgi:hypothetical protein